jgi:hypothetical protein
VDEELIIPVEVEACELDDEDDDVEADEDEIDAEDDALVDDDELDGSPPEPPMPPEPSVSSPQATARNRAIVGRSKERRMLPLLARCRAEGREKITPPREGAS